MVVSLGEVARRQLLLILHKEVGLAVDQQLKTGEEGMGKSKGTEEMREENGKKEQETVIICNIGRRRRWSRRRRASEQGGRQCEETKV